MSRLRCKPFTFPTFRRPSLGQVDGRSRVSTIDEQDLIAGVTLRARIFVVVAVVGVVLFLVLSNSCSALAAHRSRSRQGGRCERGPPARRRRRPAAATLLSGSWSVSRRHCCCPCRSFCRESYVTRNRGRIAAGTWAPPTPTTEDSDDVLQARRASVGRGQARSRLSDPAHDRCGSQPDLSHRRSHRLPDHR